MVGLALKCYLDPADSDDRGNNANIERPGFEYNALLDMQLQKSADIVASRLSEAIRIASDAP
jgi:hypothetical protein